MRQSAVILFVTVWLVQVALVQAQEAPSRAELAEAQRLFGAGVDLADAEGQIVSIQTDALPTRSDFCSAVWPDGCNAHHSSWMHLYQPTPPTE